MTSSTDVAIEIDSARPDGRRAHQLHHHLRDNTVRSTVALVQSAEKGLRADHAELVDRWAAVDTTRPFSPAVYINHFALLAAISRSDAGAVRSAVNALALLRPEDCHAEGLTLATVRGTAWENPILTRLRAHPVPDRFGRMTVMDPLPADDFARCEADVRAALELIEAADPEMRAEVDQYVRHVCLSRGSGITGATSLQFFGAVFLREPYPEYHRVMYFFEHLVHETSHLNLNIIQTIDPLVLNPASELRRSPLRRDPRPIMGIFHAQFVLTRLVHIYRRVQPLVTDSIFTSHAQTIEDKYQGGLATLNEAGRFSETGRRLLDSMTALCA
jgi:HEXXH motif-containing protein